MFIKCGNYYISVAFKDVYVYEQFTYDSFCTICGGNTAISIQYGDYYLASSKEGKIYVTKTYSMACSWIVKEVDGYRSLANAYGQVLTCENRKISLENPVFSLYSQNFWVEYHPFDDHYENFINDGVVIMNNNVWNGLDTDSLKERLVELEANDEKRASTSRKDLTENEPFCNLVKDNVQLELILAAIFRNNTHCATLSSHTLHPGGGTEKWHNDYPYHDVRVFYPNYKTVLGVQVMWLLDDFTLSNGATRYIPDSFKIPYFPHPPEVVNRNVGNDRFLVAPKGSVIIVHSAMWHTVCKNNTQRSRSCLLSTFVPTWVAKKG